MKKKISLALASAALLGTLGYGATVTIVKADDNFDHPLIQVLSERFGLSEDEVEGALDEIRADHFAMRQQHHEDGLNKAVEQGLLTEEQKNALMEKHQEMWEERNQERQQHFEEMQVWFDEQGIDHQSLMNHMGGPGSRVGFGRGHGMSSN